MVSRLKDPRIFCRQDKTCLVGGRHFRHFAHNLVAVLLCILKMDSTSGHVFVEYDDRLCIICQETSKLQLVSNENGRNRIREFARIKQDNVYKRLQPLAQNSTKFLPVKLKFPNIFNVQKIIRFFR